MAKYSKKVMGKEVGDASVYAEPHEMTGKTLTEKDLAPRKTMVSDVRMSVGNISKGAYPEPKTTGIKVRGTGAATKGTMARGPMA